MKKQLINKVALITGGGRGLGERIALAFADEGVNIAILSEIKPELETVAKKIRAKGQKALVLEADVREPALIKGAVEKTLKTFGKIDILVNCAGIPMVADSTELSVDDFDRCLDINLRGTFLCCQAAGREMIKKKAGKIINIASLHAFAAYPKRAAYVASKGGVVALTRVLGIEWAPYGINVNAVAPGQMYTKMQEELVKRGVLNLEKIISRTPIGRLVRPEDVLGAVIFLASPESDLIVGQTIIIDGGLLSNAL